MVTPPSSKQLIEANYLKSRIFDFNENFFIKPYEDLMMIDEPIHQHLAFLHFLVVEFNLKTVFEIGVKEGFSTVAFASAVKEIGGHLYSCDVKAVPIAEERVFERKLIDYWTFYQMDSLKVPWRKQIDCLFIDGLHTGKQVLAELDKFEKHVKKGGFIILHDTQYIYGENMKQKILEYFIDNPKFHYYRFFNDCGLGIARKL